MLQDSWSIAPEPLEGYYKGCWRKFTALFPLSACTFSAFLLLRTLRYLRSAPRQKFTTYCCLYIFLSKKTTPQ